MWVRDILLEPDYDNPISVEIADITKSKYSHTAVQLKNEDLIIEAEFFEGVVSSSTLKWNYKNKGRNKYYSDWYWSDFDPRTLIGQKYFKGFFVNYVLYRILTYFGIKNSLLNRVATNQTVCSMINARCRGIKEYWKILPKDIEKYVIK